MTEPITKEQLELRINNLLGEIKGWIDIRRLNLQPYPSNPYARIKNGAILSNGQKEKETIVYTIYWDGSVVKGSHL